MDDPSLCMDVNASVSWELPSRDILDSWTTTFGYDEDTTLTPLSLGTQRAIKLKKVQAKKLVKSNKSNFFPLKLHFWQF